MICGEVTLHETRLLRACGSVRWSATAWALGALDAVGAHQPVAIRALCGSPVLRMASLEW